MSPSSAKFSSFARRAAAVTATAALGVAGIAGCSDGGSSGSSGAESGESSGSGASQGEGVEGQGTVPLTIANPNGSITTQSHNPFVGDSSAALYNYNKVVFEPMVIVNQTGELDMTPWLAESFDWNEDYTELKVKARSDVKWSDGEDFTADDIAFTFGMIKDGKLVDGSGLNLADIAVDGDEVTMSFGQSMFTRQMPLFHTAIVPEHIWKDIEDPKTDPLTGEGQLVGTGPYVMDNWSTESVTMTARDDWWAGDLAVPELHYISYGDNNAVATALASGEADWAQAFIPQIQSAYLDVDPDNHYWAAPTTQEVMLFFNLQKAPFDDLALRQALAWTIDRDEWAEIAREGAADQIWNKTGLSELLKKEVVDEYKDDNYSVDTDKAREILTEAGYTWDSSGALIDPDGNAVSMRFTSPAGWSDWNSMQQLVVNQVKDGIGAEVKIDTPDWGGWDEAITEGTFEMTLHWTELTGNAYGPYTAVMDPRWIVDDKAAFNYGRYDNPAVTEALNKYAQGGSEEDREAALKVIEAAFVEDVPAIALGTDALLGEFNTRNYVGFPDADDPYATANPQMPNIVLILQKLKVKG